MSIDELTFRRESLCLPGRSAEPVVSAEVVRQAIPPFEVEQFRPLLPVGYDHVAWAYREAANSITAADLTNHYTTGLDGFHQEFLPNLKRMLTQLSGGCWNLEDYVGFAAGSDVDLMTWIVQTVSETEPVSLYPGDWYGFLIGCTHDERIMWQETAGGSLACLCIPSVRNGHLTQEMMSFLESAENCLLNLNLFPTLTDFERSATAQALETVLPKSILSISFSRGFGMTASQLGVGLIHKDHPWRDRFRRQWEWSTYFFNALAAKTFQKIDLSELQAVDAHRREWVENWLQTRGFPVVSSGSYYVKSFHLDGQLPLEYDGLLRDQRLRLCFKPPQT